MAKDISVRSPLFYVGDKYKLMPQLSKLFPQSIDNYIEPFVGGGSSFLNTNANQYYLNDIDPWIIRIHEELNKFTDDKDKLFAELFKIIEKYDLTCTLLGRDVPEGYRKKYIKTYFARANKDSYLKARDEFNANKDNILLLYILLIYGFNHMIRFNSKGDFNLPVGNVDFNKNVERALNDYTSICAKRKLHFANQDYKEFIKSVPLATETTYVYCDPPYLISGSEYNKLWKENDEKELYEMLDSLNEQGIYFGVTNLLNHKGKTNNILLEWSKSIIPTTSSRITSVLMIIQLKTTRRRSL